MASTACAGNTGRNTGDLAWHDAGVYPLGHCLFLGLCEQIVQNLALLACCLGVFTCFLRVFSQTLSFLWFEDLMILPQWTLLAPIGIFALIASF